MEKIEKGKIVSFATVKKSGLSTLILEDPKGNKVVVPCEHPATARAFDACYGGVLRKDGTADQTNLIGKVLYWSFEETGLVLGAFTPEDEAGDVLLREYELQHQ